MQMVSLSLCVSIICSHLPVWKCRFGAPSSGHSAGATLSGTPGPGRASGPWLRRACPGSDREAPADAPRRTIPGHC